MSEMDADAISSASAVVAGIALGRIILKFVVADCKVTILSGPNRIHAGVAAHRFA